MRCGRDQWKAGQRGAAVGKSVCLLGAAIPTQPITGVLFQQNHWKPHHKEDRAGIILWILLAQKQVWKITNHSSHSCTIFMRHWWKLGAASQGLCCLSPSFWCVQVLTFLRRKEGFLSLVLKHIDTSAMMDVLLRLISCVEPPPLRLETLTVWDKWTHIHLKPNTQ